MSCRPRGFKRAAFLEGSIIVTSPTGLNGCSCKSGQLDRKADASRVLTLIVAKRYMRVSASLPAVPSYHSGLLSETSIVGSIGFPLLWAVSRNLKLKALDL